MTAPASAAEAAALVAGAFELASIPYAIGGALAYGLYGAPRATLDVDVNLFVAQFGDFRLDLFVPSIPFCREAERTRVRLPAPPFLEAAWFLSAEAITLFKLLFFRSKDLADLERLVARQGARLDVAYVRARLVEMMGEDDVRVRRWDELVREFGAA